jgi:hypothetical protein
VYVIAEICSTRARNFTRASGGAELGGVAQGEHAQPLVAVDRADRTSTAMPSPPSAPPHGFDPAAGRQPDDVARDQQLDRAADELSSHEAGELLDLVVRVQDAAVGAYHEEAFRGGVEQRAGLDQAGEPTVVVEGADSLGPGAHGDPPPPLVLVRTSAEAVGDLSDGARIEPFGRWNAPLDQVAGGTLLHAPREP